MVAMRKGRPPCRWALFHWALFHIASLWASLWAPLWYGSVTRIRRWNRSPEQAAGITGGTGRRAGAAEEHAQDGPGPCRLRRNVAEPVSSHAGRHDIAVKSVTRVPRMS